MPDQPQKPPRSRPSAIPPPPPKPVKAMRDPFTDQATHPAGEGQGANQPQPDEEMSGADEEESGPVEGSRRGLVKERMPWPTRRRPSPPCRGESGPRCSRGSTQMREEIVQLGLAGGDGHPMAAGIGVDNRRPDRRRAGRHRWYPARHSDRVARRRRPHGPRWRPAR